MAMKRSKTVEQYIGDAGDWSDGLEVLRGILLKAPLEETVKWGAPSYTHGGRIVVGLLAFKEHFGLWFYDAEALADPESVLKQAKGGKSTRMRQWRFESTKKIPRRKVAAYVKNAIALAQAPRASQKRSTVKPKLPPELAGAFSKNARARKAFDALTPGKQREYAEYVAEAKREATKATRVAKILPMIAAGAGLNDRYK